MCSNNNIKRIMEIREKKKGIGEGTERVRRGEMDRGEWESINEKGIIYHSDFTKEPTNIQTCDAKKDFKAHFGVTLNYHKL